MSKEPVYWITKDGTKMNVDDMTDNHVRNAFKLLLRRLEAVRKIKSENQLDEIKKKFLKQNDISNSGNFDDDLEPYAFDWMWK